MKAPTVEPTKPTSAESPTVEPTKPTAVEPTKPTSMKATTTTEAAVTGIGHPWLKSGGGKQHDRGGGPESPSNCITHPPTPPTALMCGFASNGAN